MGENGEWHLERERVKEKKRESHFCRKMKCDGYQGNLNKEGRKKKRRQKKRKKKRRKKGESETNEGNWRKREAKVTER